MPEVTIVYWSDIPAQVIVGKGRRGSKVQLPERFEQAIDRCAMKVGARDTDAYLAEWRKAPPTRSRATRRDRPRHCRAAGRRIRHRPPEGADRKRWLGEGLSLMTLKERLMALFPFRKTTPPPRPPGLGRQVEAFLKGYSIEVMPRTAEKIEDFRALLPAGTRVYIAHIDGTPIEDMVATAKRIGAEGL
jgi:hypothetical protein